MPETYIVDPNGDIIIRLLFSPSETFAPWREKENTEPDSDNVKSLGHDEFEAKVSSRHLALASYYFEAMLSGPWLEAVSCADGLRHVCLKDEEGFDPDALKILLNVIHGKNRIVPRSVDFEMLAKIAVMVDYFQCHEALEVYINIWIEPFTRKPLPTSLSRDLVLWILISSVFNKPIILKSATKIAILHGAGPMPTMKLPIMSSIIENVHLQQQSLVGQVLDAIRRFSKKLAKDETGCTFECNSVLLAKSSVLSSITI
ncbi:hypothetical protein OOU_Y34scaffold00868g2 [Pyricularia oryzae Y34]|uniref:BTB domain-containing protein n=2 Tax=Pyricularia TaxID=48558 RepID=A0A6P8ANN2_PYRGI|nr:uncharacterized protein PgNI_11639 [Pyricularia grisea]ELQ33835.1 hypothetical protein OOU_Y34scaffold00868g2 [Pyricularia oryzae Y34]TLD03626.1 hypothetical protein PgNI_11639 [Pyricularia grisea]